MTDTKRIEKLEKEVRELQDELETLQTSITRLSRLAARREGVQDAVDDLQNSIQLIFKHVRVPGVTYKPGRRLTID